MSEKDTNGRRPRWFDGLGAMIPCSLIESGTLAHMNDSMLKTYLVFAHHADWHTGIAWPGVDRIARLIGKTDRTVLMAKNLLVETGLMSEVSKGGGSGRPTVYRLGDPARRQTPKPTSGFDEAEPRNPSPATPKPPASNPEIGRDEPRSGFRGNEVVNNRGNISDPSGGGVTDSDSVGKVNDIKAGSAGDSAKPPVDPEAARAQEEIERLRREKRIGRGTAGRGLDCGEVIPPAGAGPDHQAQADGDDDAGEGEAPDEAR